MAKDIKIGVHRGDGEPVFHWNVLILDAAFNEAMKFLDESQYEHVAEQVQELAREMDPTHPIGQSVLSVEDFFELKDKGGPLGKINVRVFFILDKPRQAIVVLGAIFKQNNGKTPLGTVKTMNADAGNIWLAIMACRRSRMASDRRNLEVEARRGDRNENSPERKKVMSKGEIVTGGKEQGVSVGEAALTMAIGIIVERVGRLPADDRKDLYHLVRGLDGLKDPEEVEAIRMAMLEILEQSPSGVRKMSPSGQRPDKLQKWVDYIGPKVKAAREKANLTQAELAEKSGLPQSHISRIESSKLSPSRMTVEKMAKALKLPLRDLDPSA